MFTINTIDHIVLCTNDVPRALDFYSRVLGMEQREERAGKWSLHFGANKISLQDASSAPAIAKGTVPGSGNFCLLTDTPLEQVITHLRECGIPILEGPAKRIGATGLILSVYFYDPDGNLVEVSNTLYSHGT